MNSNEVHFDRKEVVPDDLKLKKALGDTYLAYREILALVETFQAEWKFYGAKIGWQLKISRKGKVLFYLTPQDGSFRLGFAVREKEREMLLNSKLPVNTKELLAAAKKYPEGYPLRLQIKKEGDMKVVCLVVEVLKALRT